MAEIKIERKERSILPWLLAGILLLGLLWFLFARNNDNAVASGAGDSTYRDTSAAAGTLAPGASTGARTDSAQTVPPR